jgi:dienelactone hydrolase
MDVKHPISTAQVPAKFLKPAMLIGSTPLKALQSDPRVSYNLYIPPDHYNPDPTRNTSTEGEGSHPSYKLPRIPLVVSVHGTGRDAGTCRRRLISFADTERCAILAPLFPAGLDDELDYDSYKLLRSKTLKSDLALLDIVKEVAIRYPGIDTGKFFLVGFSGGGQFVHRFLYIYPERVFAASVGAPGRVTRLDKTLKWPQGIADVGEVFQKDLTESDGEISLEGIRKINGIQMIVGGDDTEVPGEFNDWVAKLKGKAPKSTTPTLEPMWISRVETLKKLHEEWHSLGISSTFEVVEGVKHDSNGVNPTVVKFLEPLMREWWHSREG